MNRTIKAMGVVWLVVIVGALVGCNQTMQAGGGEGDSTTREARSLLGSIFKIDGKILGVMDLEDMAPLLNAAGKAYGVTSAGDTAVEWDDKLLEALGRKVDEAAEKGVDPFDGVASVDGPWVDADGAPVKFPIRRERTKRITETFGAPTTPPVVVRPPPVIAVPPASPSPADSNPPETPAPPAAADPVPPRPVVPGVG